MAQCVEKSGFVVCGRWVAGGWPVGGTPFTHVSILELYPIIAAAHVWGNSWLTPRHIQMGGLSCGMNLMHPSNNYSIFVVTVLLLLRVTIFTFVLLLLRP